LHRLIDELQEDEAERLLANMRDLARHPPVQAPTDEAVDPRVSETAANGIPGIHQMSDLTGEERLIEKHIGLEYERPGGRADARLRRTGTPIWALVMYLGVYDGDAAQVASDFDLTEEEMDAALAFYRRNRKYVEASVLLNEA